MPRGVQHNISPHCDQPSLTMNRQVDRPHAAKMTHRPGDDSSGAVGVPPLQAVLASGVADRCGPPPAAAADSASESCEPPSGRAPAWALPRAWGVCWLHCQPGTGDRRGCLGRLRGRRLLGSKYTAHAVAHSTDAWQPLQWPCAQEPRRFGTINEVLQGARPPVQSPMPPLHSYHAGALWVCPGPINWPEVSSIHINCGESCSGRSRGHRPGAWLRVLRQVARRLQI